MIIKIIDTISKLLSPRSQLSEPVKEQIKQIAAEVKADDDRFFVWVRARNGTLSPVHAQIIHDRGVGPKQDIVAEHKLSVAEYRDDISTLISRYPAPTVIVDYGRSTAK